MTSQDVSNLYSAGLLSGQAVNFRVEKPPGY